MSSNHNLIELNAGICKWMHDYNHQRIHQTLYYAKPWQLYRPKSGLTEVPESMKTRSGKLPTTTRRSDKRCIGPFSRRNLVDYFPPRAEKQKQQTMKTATPFSAIDS
jgi:hypothetical protein